MKTIRIKSTSYPCYPTMGGMVFFKKTTGKSITQIDGEEDLVTLCYAQTKAACKSEGVAFPFTDVDDFACSLSPEDFAAWCNDMSGVSEADESKKKKTLPKSKD